MIQDHDGQYCCGLATVVVDDRQRDRFVPGDIPSHDGVDSTACDGRKIIVSCGRSRANSDPIGEGPIIGQNFSIIVHKDIWQDQTCVGHGGHGFGKDLHRNPVVDADLYGFDPGVDAIGYGKGEVEDGALTVDFTPLMLFSIGTHASAARSIAPIPLEVQVLNGNVIDGPSC